MGWEAHSVYCTTFFSGLLASEGEDLATMVIEFRNGCLGNLTENWCSEARGELNSFQLDGTEGAIIVRNERIQLYNSAGKIVEESPVSPDIGPTFTSSLTEFLDAIGEGREPDHSGRDNLGTMAMVEAAYSSAAEGSKVEIEFD